MMELPKISSCNYSTSDYKLTTTGTYNQWEDPEYVFRSNIYDSKIAAQKAQAIASYGGLLTPPWPTSLDLGIKKEEKKKMSAGRVVQVFIVDPDVNVPVAQRLLYVGDQVFTDMSDQDLFFDIEIKNLLNKHNKLRAQIENKKKSSATEKVYLEPIRVSDLKMVVSNLASF